MQTSKFRMYAVYSVVQKLTLRRHSSHYRSQYVCILFVPVPKCQSVSGTLWHWYRVPNRLDCSLLGAIGMHYAHLRLGLGLGLGLRLGLVLGLGVGLALVFSETNCTVTVYFNGAQ